MQSVEERLALTKLEKEIAAATGVKEGEYIEQKAAELLTEDELVELRAGRKATEILKARQS